MASIPLRPVNLRLSHAPRAVITNIIKSRERAMLAITILAVYLIVMAALNIIDFGRVD